MLSLLKSWRRSRKSRSDRRPARRLFLESLEARQLLAADLQLSVVRADATGAPALNNDPVAAGDVIYYRIVLTNQGADPALSVDLTDILPANASLNGSF